MKRLLPAAAAVAALAAAASPAAAQQAGVYSGTSMDGNTVSFTVGQGSGVGKLAIVSATIFFSDLCSDGSTFSSAWGLGFVSGDIVNHKVKVVDPYPYFTFTYNLVFSSDNLSATGFIAAVSPTLSPIGPTPKKALFCRSKKQPMGVTFQHAAKVSPPTHGAVWLGADNAATH